MPAKKAAKIITPTPVIKSIWKTKPEPSKGKAGNQDRLVLHVSATHVHYASRGGNIINKFNTGKCCQIQRIIKVAKFDRNATSAEWNQTQQDLASWIKAQGI
jgi:hypothetical protein